MLLLIPNPRLRGRVRSREYFPSPTWPGALALAGVIVLGAAVLATTLSAADATIYVRIFPFAIFALSLVPLTGFAGRISLCQLSFAAIGASVWAQWGNHGNPLWMLGAAVVAAVIGALVALPALRLSGIYLALATAAFAVTLDRWVWTLPPLKLFGTVTLNLFQTGSASASALKLFGYTFDTAPRQMMLMATVLALLTLLVVAIRRSAFGRRLLALKDSEAACATLGMRLIATKTAVFAISAGMAGLGGALYASQLQSIQTGNFDFITGLPVLLIAVIGGMAYAGTGLFGGLSLQAGLPLISQLGTFFANLCGPAARARRYRSRPEPERRHIRSARRVRSGLARQADLRGGDRRRGRDLAAAARARVQELAVRAPRRGLGLGLAGERRRRRPPRLATRRSRAPREQCPSSGWA